MFPDVIPAARWLRLVAWYMLLRAVRFQADHNFENNYANERPATIQPHPRGSLPAGPLQSLLRDRLLLVPNGAA